MSETPIDAYGQPLAYRQTTEGVIVCSASDNMQDEQGYNEREYEGSNQFPDADDFPVVLYNPELRNALPPPDKAIADYDEWSELDKSLYDKPDDED